VSTFSAIELKKCGEKDVVRCCLSGQMCEKFAPVGFFCGRKENLARAVLAINPVAKASLRPLYWGEQDSGLAPPQAAKPSPLERTRGHFSKKRFKTSIFQTFNRKSSPPCQGRFCSI
jgi:hypothetical protein